VKAGNGPPTPQVLDDLVVFCTQCCQGFFLQCRADCHGAGPGPKAECVHCCLRDAFSVEGCLGMCVQSDGTYCPAVGDFESLCSQ
jgi:hypothetical protein